MVTFTHLFNPDKQHYFFEEVQHIKEGQQLKKKQEWMIHTSVLTVLQAVPLQQ